MRQLMSSLFLTTHPSIEFTTILWRRYQDRIDTDIKYGYHWTPWSTLLISTPFHSEEGQSLRLCMDYWKLNKVTLVQQELMPNPENMFLKLAEVTIFTKINLTRGYWQIKLDPASKHYTSFSSPIGNMQFCRLPFGLASVSSTFTKLMWILTYGRNEVSYLGDMLIFSSSLETQIMGVTAMLETIRKFGLWSTNNNQKLVVTKEVTFLGYMIRQGKII